MKLPEGFDAEGKFAQESTRTFAAGEVIFAEGEDSREMYVIGSGVVEIIKESARGEVKLAELHRGDFFGEMSLLESLPRSATARAVDNVRLLAIHPGGFLLKIRRDPTFAFEMLQSLSRRIRTTNESLMHELARDKTSTAQIKAILEDSEFHKRKNGAIKIAPKGSSAA